MMQRKVFRDFKLALSQDLENQTAAKNRLLTSSIIKIEVLFTCNMLAHAILKLNLNFSNQCFLFRHQLVSLVWAYFRGGVRDKKTDKSFGMEFCISEGKVFGRNKVYLFDPKELLINNKKKETPE